MAEFAAGPTGRRDQRAEPSSVGELLSPYPFVLSSQPDENSLDFSSCMLRPGIKNAQELACGVCLLNVDSRSRVSHHLPPTTSKAEHVPSRTQGTSPSGLLLHMVCDQRRGADQVLRWDQRSRDFLPRGGVGSCCRSGCGSCLSVERARLPCACSALCRQGG